MKNPDFKFLILNILILPLLGCPNPNVPNFLVAGIWQNSIKNSDNSTITTNLEITEKLENFDAKMSIVLNGTFLTLNPGNVKFKKVEK